MLVIVIINTILSVMASIGAVYVVIAVTDSLFDINQR